MNEIELKVTGMVCGGCENRVKNALSLIDGVENVVASHETNKVKITTSKDVDLETIKEKIQDLDFKVED